MNLLPVLFVLISFSLGRAEETPGRLSLDERPTLGQLVKSNFKFRNPTSQFGNQEITRVVLEANPVTLTLLKGAETFPTAKFSIAQAAFTSPNLTPPGEFYPAPPPVGDASKAAVLELRTVPLPVADARTLISAIASAYQLHASQIDLWFENKLWEINPRGSIFCESKEGNPGIIISASSASEVVGEKFEIGMTITWEKSSPTQGLRRVLGQ